MRELIKKLPHKSGIPDFEELMLLESIRAVTRLWRQGETLHDFAFVDEFNNLWYETDRVNLTDLLEGEIVAWGVQCMEKRNAATGRADALDCLCSGDDLQRMAMLERNGFVRQNVRTLCYARSLDEPIAAHPLPPGFSIRSVEGEVEVESLVALHRAAFGTDNMTVEQRRAIMLAPQYDPALDFVIAAPDGDRCAFCICAIDVENERVGYTDPIGVNPRYQNKGLGKAVVSAGMQALKRRGVTRVELGTSSDNTAMQRLAETLGFVLVSDSLWFSKSVD